MEEPIDFCNLDMVELAKQMCVRQHKKLRKMNVSHLGRQTDSQWGISVIKNITCHNEFMNWCISMALKESQISCRVVVFSKLIEFAHASMKLNNFATTFVVYQSLSAFEIFRLKRTWEVCTYVLFF